MKASAIVMFVIGLCSTSAFAVPEPTNDWPNPPEVEACEKAMVTVSAAPKAQLPAAQVDLVNREMTALIDAFASGQVTGINVVSDYAQKMGAVPAMLRSPLMRGEMDGPGVDQSLANLEDQMTELSKVMALFQPHDVEARRPGLMGRALGLIGRGRDQALSITATFQSNEEKVASILKGLEKGRLALMTDNGLLKGEIERVFDKMANILEQIEVWKLRKEKLEAFRNELAAEAGRTTPDRRKLMQVDLVQNELLLPIVQTLQMLEKQHDIFQAAVVAHRIQQKQNDQAIQSGWYLEKTAEELLPTIVMSAVTAARHARVMNIQNLGTKLLEDGMTAVGRQMTANATALDAAMAKGGVDQEKIFQFRDVVAGVVIQLQASQGNYYVQIEAARQVREEKMKNQDDLINAVVNSTALGLLPAPAGAAAPRLGAQ